MFDKSVMLIIMFSKIVRWPDGHAVIGYDKPAANILQFFFENILIF